MSRNTIPGWLTALAVGGTLLGLMVWERRRPLRRTVESKARRELRNMTVAALSATAIRLTEKPLNDRLTRLVEERGWGLLKQFSLSPALETALGLVLLDYTLYLWHVLTHRSPLLWRLHQVHHVDLDLDASTALRFHFAEMVASVPWRAAQIVLLGISPRALSLWQTALLVEILFHHSNVNLPPQVERWLGRIIVTPRLHGIHHSQAPAEMSSNWSSGLTVWDWLHGTLRTDVPQQAITIGVKGFHRPEQVTLPRILALPLEPPATEYLKPSSDAP